MGDGETRLVRRTVRAGMVVTAALVDLLGWP
jgi:hypothetical protein